jgi:adenylate cyclase
VIELLAQGPEPDDTWTTPLTDAPIRLGRRAPESTFNCPWDAHISRFHATLTWSDRKLHVQRNQSAVNPIFYRGKVNNDFELSVGEQFVIGGTTFTLVETVPVPANEEASPPLDELTCTRQELDAAAYTESEERIKVLAALPAMIRQSSSDEQLESQVLQALLQGMPRAQVAAVVWLDPTVPPELPEIVVRTCIDRNGNKPNMRPSRGLVVDALRRRRQAVMHRWGSGANSDSRFKTVGTGNWALCAPLPDEVSPGFALYLTGKVVQAEVLGGTNVQDYYISDLKFAELVADIFGALWQLRDLQGRQLLLTQFVSPIVREAFRRDIDQVLKPRESEVTVLFCDLRGSCRIAEGGEQDLAVSHSRMGLALTTMTTNIIDMDGVIGDFQGDACMAFFGWPFASADQVEQACKAALAIARDFLRASQRPGDPLEGFACGIGIASGKVIAGRMGTADQLQVGVFGPVVNLAARLESMTKIFRVPILIDDHAAEQLRQRRSRRCRLRRVAKVQPYGMRKALVISELLPPESESGVLPDRELRNYEAALDAFQSGRWQDAQSLLRGMKTDGPAELLRQKMAQCGAAPPPGWNGIFTLDQK